MCLRVSGESKTDDAPGTAIMTNEKEADGLEEQLRAARAAILHDRAQRAGGVPANWRMFVETVASPAFSREDLRAEAKLMLAHPPSTTGGEDAGAAAALDRIVTALFEQASRCPSCQIEVVSEAQVRSALAALSPASPAADPQGTFEQGIEAAAKCAEEHRQELFEDGLEADLHDFGDDVKSAFLAGCQQERDCIVDAIRSLRPNAAAPPPQHATGNIRHRRLDELYDDEGEIG